MHVRARAPWKLILMKATPGEKDNSCPTDFLSAVSEKIFENYIKIVATFSLLFKFYLTLLMLWNIGCPAGYLHFSEQPSLYHIYTSVNEWLLTALAFLKAFANSAQTLPLESFLHTTRFPLSLPSHATIKKNNLLVK